MRRCGIVILAAGGSSRMGKAKQSLEFEGTSLLRRAVDTAMVSVCRPMVVVLGARVDELTGSLNGCEVQIVVNENWAAGMGTSIRAGVSAIGQVDAVMLFLADQPLITGASLNEMTTVHFQSGMKITVAEYAGTLGTPAIFSSSLMDQLMSLEDGQGGKAVIQRHMQDLKRFALPSAEMDVDTPEEYARLKKPELGRLPPNEEPH